MESYENLIMQLLHGQTPQQKYNYLVNLLSEKVCNCSVDETTGNSKIKCCNICGKPLKSENWL